MEKPLISVLMTNYNRGSIIEQTIHSVLNQTYTNLELIIVDDGSTDNSCEVISSIPDTRIKLYHMEKNSHICTATNEGFKKVNGSYLARIDSDDIWYPEKLEKQLAFLQTNNQYRICFSWIDLIDEHGNNINQEQEPLLKMFEKSFRGQTDSLHYFFFEGNCLSHPSVLMETSLMTEIGDFYPGYMQSHDYDYWVRIAKKYPLYVMEERLLAMRRFCSEESSSNNSSHEVENGVRFYNEYADIKEHFFDDLDDRIFIETFQSDFRCTDSVTPDELACEKAFLLLWESTQKNGLLPAGVERFFTLFSEQRTSTLLEIKYNFALKDLYQLTGQHMYYDRWQEEQTKENERLLQQNISLTKELHAIKNELLETVTTYENEKSQLLSAIRSYDSSFCWKVTKPLRLILDLLKK